MVKSASDYPWSSYPFFIGKLKMPAWLTGEWLLSQFGKNLPEARKNYRVFVEGVDPWTLEDPGKSPVGGFILGGQDFVSWVKETFLPLEPASKEKPQLTARQSGADLNDIVKDKKLKGRIKRLEKQILNNKDAIPMLWVPLWN